MRAETKPGPSLVIALYYDLYLPDGIQTIPVLLLQEVGGAAERKGRDSQPPTGIGRPARQDDYYYYLRLKTAL